MNWSLFTCSIETPANCDAVLILRYYDLDIMVRLLKIAHSCE